MDKTSAETALEDAPKRARGRPRKTPDERDDGNRRQALLSAAARLFRLQGFDGTSTRDIATAAGMQSGSPFYHFKSKDALLYAVMEAGMHSAISRQVQAIDGALPPADAREALRRLIQVHFEVLLGPGKVAGGMQQLQRMMLTSGVTTASDMATGIFADFDTEAALVRSTFEQADNPSRMMLMPMVFQRGKSSIRGDSGWSGRRAAALRCPHWRCCWQGRDWRRKWMLLRRRCPSGNETSPGGL